MKHRVLFWPQGKGHHCLHHETGEGERLWRERAAGPAGPVGVTPAFTSPAVPFCSLLSSLFHLALPFSGCSLTQFIYPILPRISELQDTSQVT